MTNLLGGDFVYTPASDLSGVEGSLSHDCRRRVMVKYQQNHI